MEYYVHKICHEMAEARISNAKIEENAAVKRPESLSETETRLEEMQELGDLFAKVNHWANRVTLYNTKFLEISVDEARAQYGLRARLQLVMRQRNNMSSFPSNTVWCIAEEVLFNGWSIKEAG